MSEIIVIISSLISIIYLILLLLLIVGIRKLKVFQPFETNFNKSFSIIIPFRNESIHLNYLLQSLKNLDYPSSNFEIILVNDSSTDDSEKLVRQFIDQHSTIQIKLIQNNIDAKSPKKEAIEKAINWAQFEWIITTDADCVVPEKWLQSFDNFIQITPCDMIIAPVIFTSDSSFLQDFQQLDFLSLMGATQGGFGIGFPFLCNGANLCYQKSVFMDVNGFEGNTNIASGDDIFLMEKFLNHDKKSVKYLKSTESVVQTQPQKTVKEFINQRIRWAAKTSAYKNKVGKLVGLIVLSMNLWLFLSPLLLSLKWISFPAITIIWLIKLFIDFILLWQIAGFYRIKISITKYLIFSFMYPFYTVIVGFLSYGKGYEWKDRRFLR
jgi:cellulose synthase/poly-beta-1,6-N-acetylglucosamine synthase-like glycosyltransferase